MKIYYDTDRDLIIIGGLKQVFAPQSLTAVIVNNNTIAIRLINDTINLIAPQPFQAFQDSTGATRNNILDTLNYLLGEFTKTGVPADLDLVAIFNSVL